MKRRAWRVLAAVALTSIFQTAALAAHASTVAYEEGSNPEVSVLRAEIDALRSQLHSGMAVGYNNHQPPAPTPATGSEGGSGAPGCGCGTSCGCGASCGCGNACGCGCGSCCDSCCNSCCETGGTCGCFEPCCHCPGLWASAELMWFRYHRADGVRVGTDEVGDDAEFDFEITPRFTVGWVGEDGLGFRLRYWEFDHNADAIEDAGSRVSVDTYTFDFEVFDTFCLNRNWDLEIAAGIRYNEFLEVMADIPGDNDLRFNSFSGFGGVASVELRRLVGTNGVVWVRARSAILMDDKDILNDPGQGQQVRLLDVTVGMTELAFGYDYVTPLCDGSYAFVGVQAEWQNWYNYSSGFEDTEDNEDFAGPSDVGFGGFGIRAGVVR